MLCHAALRPGVVNHVLGLEDGKKRFADHVLAAAQAFALCCTLDKALAYRDELAFLQAVKSAITKAHHQGQEADRRTEGARAAADHLPGRGLR